MKRVVTFGVFDYFHLGHLRLFETAKEYGDYLIVAVQSDDHIFKTKPNSVIFYNTTDRKELISALKIVDEVIVYDDVDNTLPKIDFDIFVVGEDQNHTGFQNAIKWCVENDKEVRKLPRTPGICSSEMKRKLQLD